MAYCDVCGNFDDSHFEDLKETYQDIDMDAHQPDLYYYCLLYTSDAADEL